jgi:hypothetical protein
MASTNLAALQATTNRFADKVGFAPIPADGGMGQLTINAVMKTLAWVGDGGGVFDFGLSDGTRGVAAGFAQMLSAAGAGVATILMQKNVDINTTLMAAASELGLAATPKPVVSSGGGGGGVVPRAPTGVVPSSGLPGLPGGGGAGSIVGAFTSMPLPVKLAMGGIVIGIGYFLFFDTKRRSRR